MSKGSFKKYLLLGSLLLLADLILLTLGGSDLYSYFRRGKVEKGSGDQLVASSSTTTSLESKLSLSPTPPLLNSNNNNIYNK
jgi:hypothetical protein